MRGDSLFGNGREYERGGVADVIEQHANINNAMSIAYLRALGDGYGNSRTWCRRCLNEKGEGGDNERSGKIHSVSRELAGSWGSDILSWMSYDGEHLYGNG